MIPIPTAKFFIGRGDDCHLRPKSDAISRHHCAIVSTNNQVAIRDFGSKNGTFVNGQRIDSAYVLKSGDVLGVGPLTFEIVMETSLNTGKRPKVKSLADVAERSAQSTTDDEDVASWLEDAMAETGTEEAITRQFTFESKDTQDALNDDTDPGEVEGDEHDDGSSILRWFKKKKKEPGKLPKVDKEDEVGDSRDAATDTLRKYFNRS
jgi:pSer/pThr/pTyr-binding forkhead associated (FHA) protein